MIGIQFKTYADFLSAVKKHGPTMPVFYADSVTEFRAIGFSDYLSVVFCYGSLIADKPTGLLTDFPGAISIKGLINLPIVI